MKLFAVVVFGYVALAGTEAFSSHHHGHSTLNDDVQRRMTEQGSEHTSSGLNSNQGQDNLESIYQRNQENSNGKTLYNSNQKYNQGQNDDFSETNWNVQSRHSQNKNNQNYNRNDDQMNFKSGSNQQNSEEYDQQQSYSDNNNNQNYGLSADFNSESSESNSQEDYIKEHNNADVADEIGLKVAQKMVKFFNIIDKYTALNGTVQINQVQEPLPLRQLVLPMEQHQFLSMFDTKVYGLSQGIIKAMYINTDKDIVDLEYLFKTLLVKGNFKASMGSKKSFNLMLTKTDVNVSTDLQNLNQNRNYASSTNEQTELDFHNSYTSNENQLIIQNIKAKYIQFINRAIESEMIDSSYNDLVGCLKSEIKSTIDMSSLTNSKSNLVIENKKSQLTVSLTKTQEWTDDQTISKQKQVEYVAFRQNKDLNGYKLKVKVILAKQPTWKSDVFAQKGQKQINIKNVNFHAQKIVATAIMERVSKHNGSFKFNVVDASIKIEGLRFDIGKFDLIENMNGVFAREIGQNLPQMIENGMSAALQKQLYNQQQICQQNQMSCIKCSQINNL